ncbi:DUF2945 domain-containing protein [Sphingorhabdus arenilitoris]|uniref:DUF2945 domain-containing protein n=1 Tax=Sphingorhabdus arenilitoris TaxID=1490041 RepID=A0ABV8RCQ9_9SPHN
MSGSFDEGDQVRWNWGSGIARGKVVEKFTSDVTRTIKGTEVKRNANEECPAFLIEQEDGDQILKSVSEIDTV